MFLAMHLGGGVVLTALRKNERTASAVRAEIAASKEMANVVDQCCGMPEQTVYKRGEVRCLCWPLAHGPSSAARAHANTRNSGGLLAVYFPMHTHAVRRSSDHSVTSETSAPCRFGVGL